jgi:site-specific recombinase XerD
MQVRQARQHYVRWLVVTQDLSPHTIRAYDGDIAALERHAGSGASVADIDRDCVVSFVENMRISLSPRSVQRRASGVRGFCRWLVSRDHLDVDPWLGVAVAAGRSRRLPRLIPAADLDRLLCALRASTEGGHSLAATHLLARPDQATTLLGVALMVATGVRVAELVAIACEDVDLASRAVRITGKGRRERLVFLTNDWVTQLTEVYLATRAALGIEHNQLLFNRNRRPLTAAAMRSRLAKAAEDATIVAKVTPHMLRHTAATQLIEAGVDIRLIQRLLGHASLSTTEIYTHVSDRALRRVVSEADVLGRFAQAS